MRQLVRVTSVIDSQVRALRVRDLMAAYSSHDPIAHREGTYWGINSDIESFHCAGKLPAPRDRTRLLAEVDTDLAKKDARTQERLINWGYAVTDAAIRSRVAKAWLLPPHFRTCPPRHDRAASPSRAAREHRSAWRRPRSNRDSRIASRGRTLDRFAGRGGRCSGGANCRACSTPRSPKLRSVPSEREDARASRQRDRTSSRTGLMYGGRSFACTSVSEE